MAEDSASKWVELFAVQKATAEDCSFLLMKFSLDMDYLER